MSFGTINPEEYTHLEGLSFGLNQNAFIENIELNENAGKNGTPCDALDVLFNIGEKEKMLRIFLQSNVYDSNNNIVNEGSPEYEKLFKNKALEILSTITHVVKALNVEQKQIDELFKTPVATMKEWVTKILTLVPENYRELQLDVFCHYQWTIDDGQTVTFLEIPKNMKSGHYIIPAQEGNWKEVRKWKSGKVFKQGLAYVDEDTGKIHPFTRNSKYLLTNWATRQDNSNPSNTPSNW